ncbi:MAG: hypothetical protein IKS19_02205 [Clostridia bacterium]|nr:hypothetical protein [Clostridia bacterium]
MPSNICESCAYFIYDDELEEDVCSVQLDEDDYVRFVSDPHAVCPYYKYYDEYKMVRRQN